MEQDLSSTDLAKRTSELVAAYCKTLAIEPAELPNLISYVGQVLRTPEMRMTATPVLKAKSSKVAGKAAWVSGTAKRRLTQPDATCGSTNLVDLATYRKGCRQIARHPAPDRPGAHAG